MFFYIEKKYMNDILFIKETFFMYFICKRIFKVIMKKIFLRRMIYVLNQVIELRIKDNIV